MDRDRKPEAMPGHYEEKFHKLVTAFTALAVFLSLPVPLRAGLRIWSTPEEFRNLMPAVVTPAGGNSLDVGVTLIMRYLLVPNTKTRSLPQVQGGDSAAGI